MTSLRDLNPIAASQWDYEKNGETTPDNITGKSGIEAHFICSTNENHKWVTKVFQRTSNGRNIDCPYCDERKVLTGETDLLTKCKEASEFWDYEGNGDLDPSQVLYKSNKKVHFKCSRGHKFQKNIRSFVEKPGCRKCYIYDNNFAKLLPNIASMWDYEKNYPSKPEEYLKSSIKKVFWKCKKCGYSWNASIAARSVSTGLCPSCEVGSAFNSGVNDLETKHKLILQLWDYEKNTVLPSEIHLYDKRDFFWKCKTCGYSWKQKPVVRYKSLDNGQVAVRSCRGCSGRVTVPNFNDISTTHPYLAAEYLHGTNTTPIKDIRATSQMKIHWRCSTCNQVFISSTLSRTRHKDGKLHGCPYCDGKLPIIGVNDFKTLRSKLADEWNYKLNELGPENYTEFSTKVVHWICNNDCNHEWSASVYSRARGHSNCPNCQPARKKCLSFALARPELLKYWDYSKNVKLPKEVNEFSNRKVWWRCDIGHEFQCTIDKQSRKNFYCTVCNGSYLVKGINDVATLHPEFMEIWDYNKNDCTPDEVKFSENVYYYFKCNKNHSWKSTLKYVVDHVFTCDYCSNRKVLKGFNSLEDLYPKITEEWNYERNKKKPNQTLVSSKYPTYWKCNTCKMDYRATIKERINNDLCPYCSGKRPIPSKNSFAALYPKLLKKFHSSNSVDPDTILPSYSKHVKWECQQYNILWEARVRDVVEGRRKCPYCAGKRAVPGVNSLQALYPDIALNLNDENYDPDEILPTLTTRVKWKCDFDNKNYLATVMGTVEKTETCPYCSGTKVIEGVTSFKALHPELMLDYFDERYNPDELRPNFSRILKWKCDEYGELYFATPKGLVEGYESCPYCSGSKAVPGINSLETLYPEIASELNDEKYDSNEILPSLGVRVEWKCKTYKLPYYATVRDMVSGTETCPYCTGNKAVPGATSLKVLYPEITKEFDDANYNADEVLPSLAVRVKWLCKEYKLPYYATVRGVVEGSESCPYCAGRKVVPGVTSLKALYPNITMEFDDANYNADEVLPSLAVRVKWLCKEYKLSYYATVRGVVEGSESCPYCTGRKAVPGVTSLKALYPNITMEFDDENYNADEVLPSLAVRVKWMCSEYKQPYYATVRGVVDGSESCPYCSGRKAVPSITSLKALYPEITMEFNDENYNPDEVLPSLAVRVKWLCKEYKLPYYATVRGIVDGSESCPYCSGRKVVPGITSLKSKYPNMIKSEWKYLSNALIANPDEVLPSSNNSFFWLCAECKSTYITTPKQKIQNLQRKKSSCNYCKGLRTRYIIY